MYTSLAFFTTENAPHVHPYVSQHPVQQLAHNIREPTYIVLTDKERVKVQWVPITVDHIRIMGYDSHAFQTFLFKNKIPIKV